VNAAELLDEAVRTLKASPAIDHWQKDRERIEAEDLLAHVMNGDEPEADHEVAAKIALMFRALVDRRASGEPIPFIKGYSEFRGIELIAVPGVFVPRDSSEFMVEQAVRRLRRRATPIHVDLATGAGTIALAVAHEVSEAAVYGTDLAVDAVKLARRNARRLGLTASFLAGDLFDPLPRRIAGAVDVITIHPPYVARHELDELPVEIRAWEPVHTLTDHSDDGLELVRRTIDESPKWLSANGWLLLETDPDRARDVKKLFVRGGFREVQSTKGGELKVTRVVVGRRPA
jgi:release factor glutamine methyltransferase